VVYGDCVEDAVVHQAFLRPSKSVSIARLAVGMPLALDACDVFNNRAFAQWEKKAEKAKRKGKDMPVSPAVYAVERYLAMEASKEEGSLVIRQLRKEASMAFESAVCAFVIEWDEVRLQLR
jgi:hypothetical protein